jgi:hypothetical protein
MSDAPDRTQRLPSSETTERDELRTISFRMREIQRLLSVRVEQENRRLEAEGIEPVSSTKFREELAADE